MSEHEAQAWRDAYRSAMRRVSPACPADEALAALATGELAGTERLAVADHVVVCRDCAARARTLIELHDAAARSGAGWFGRSGRLAAIAAAVAVAAAGAVVLGRRPAPPSGSVVRAPAQNVRPAAGAVLGRAPAEFGWPVQDGAASYRVRLYDAGANPIWESPVVSAPPVRLQAAPPLGAGRAYFWTVELRGARRERLGPFWFQIAGAP